MTAQIENMLKRDKKPTLYGIEDSGINPQSAVSPQSAIYIRDRNSIEKMDKNSIGKWTKITKNGQNSQLLDTKHKGEGKTRGFAIIHKIEMTIELNSLINYEEIAKQYFGQNWENVKCKENQGKFYRVISFKLTRGDTLAFYEYENRIQVKVWTHSLNKAIKLAGMVKGTIKRFYIELYLRYHERSERLIDQILDAILRKYGKSQSIKYHMHKEKKITYINRLNKFEYNGLSLTIKSYRHRAYSSLSPKNPEYHPKLELAVIFNNIDRCELLDIKKKLREIAKLLNTIRILAKLKLIYSEYDKAQDKIPLAKTDNELFKILKGTTKRVKAINILNKEYYDLNHAILDLIKRGYKIREIARILGYYHNAIRYRINQLMKQGYIEKVGRGKYIVKAKLEKPRVIKRGNLNKFIELYKQGKITLKKLHYEEEDTDHINVWIFPHIKIIEISGRKAIIDQKTYKIAYLDSIR